MTGTNVILLLEVHTSKEAYNEKHKFAIKEKRQLLSVSTDFVVSLFAHDSIKAIINKLLF